MPVAVALVGFMGVGKSTVGRRLAVRLGVPFCDLDALLVDRHGPIPDQFRDVGEAGFRARERDAIVSLCDGVPRVLATGGGAFVDPDNRARLGACYRTVALTASLDTIRERLGDDPSRPLWGEGAAALLASRQDAYARAERVIDTTGREVGDLVDEIVAWLANEEASWR